MAEKMSTWPSKIFSRRNNQTNKYIRPIARVIYYVATKKHISFLTKNIFYQLIITENIIRNALYDNFDNLSKAAAVPIVAKYQYQSTYVADQEINLLAFLTEIMVECEFK